MSILLIQNMSSLDKLKPYFKYTDNFVIYEDCYVMLINKYLCHKDIT